MLAALAVLVIKVSGFDQLDGEPMLEDAGALDRFHELVEQFRNDLPQGGGAIDEAIEEAASAASDIEDDIDDSIPDIPKF